MDEQCSAIKPAGGRNLRGEGVVIGVGDNADPLAHVDFSGRIINRSCEHLVVHMEFM